LNRGRLTANIVAQLAFGLLSMTICLPSMQDWPAIFQATQANVQLTFSAYLAAYGGMQLVYGPLSDRIGRRPVLMLGLAVSGLGALAAASAAGLWQLVAARLLQGAGNAAGMVMGRALVQDHFEGADRTRVMAFIGMSMGLVPPAATLLGGQLHVRFGWQANFILLAALAVLLFLAAWRGLPASRAAVSSASRARGWREVMRGYARLAREPAFGWYVVLLTATTATFYAFLGGAPLVLATYGVTPDRVGFYIMCPPIAYIFGNLLTSRLVRVRSDGFILMTGEIVTFFSLLIVLALGLGGASSPWALALPLLILGIGHGLLVPPTLTGTVGVVPALAGTAAAIAGVMQQFGGALGGYAVGLVRHEGQVNLAWMMIGWTSLGLVAVLGLRRFTRRAA
jgi:DHA1 family bicyclomycin/chloramphenicol resistance-like MFS transporter